MTGGLPAERELQALGESLLVEWSATELSRRWSVGWNARMRTRAGVAWLEERHIDLNPKLLARNPSRVREILAHELAHLVTWHRDPSAPQHGLHWAQLMRRAGLPARRYHGMAVGDLRQRRRTFYYLHLCTTCSAWWIGKKLRRDRHCDRCGPALVHVYRAGRSVEGRRELEAIALGTGDST